MGGLGKSGWPGASSRVLAVARTSLQLPLGPGLELEEKGCILVWNCGQAFQTCSWQGCAVQHEVSANTLIRQHVPSAGDPWGPMCHPRILKKCGAWEGLGTVSPRQR